MRPIVSDTNTSIDTQSPTDATGLYSFMDISVLLLRGSLFDFPYRQASQMGKVQASKRFGMTPLVSMAWSQLEGVCPYL